MLQIVWSRAALDDLERISRFVAQHDEHAAEKLQRRIEESVLPVAHYPHLFRSGRLPDTREIVAHPNYVVVYRVLKTRVRVLNVLHARREYPPAQ
jgi:toxin ParE1/3/4